MRSAGNTLSNQKFNPSNKPSPNTSFSGGDTSEEIELERFIRDKYERKTLLRARKLPALPSPTVQGDPDKIQAILGPGARSPSLGSSSSTNLKPGQRVSGESFERAKSPASTNSSVELPPPPKPPRRSTSTSSGQNPFVQNNPWEWTGLAATLPNPEPAPASMAVKTVQERGQQDITNGLNFSHNNPFQNSLDLSMTPQSAPPQIATFPPSSQSDTNPFEPRHAAINLPRAQTMPQRDGQAQWHSPSFEPSVPNGQLSPSLMSPPFRRVSSLPQSPGMSGQQSPNPFISQQPVSSSAQPSPTNPFFNSQQLQPQSPQPQPQPLYAPSQPIYPPSQPAYAPSHSYTQQSPFQNPQTYTAASTTVVHPPRMDKQSILNLYNTPSSPNPQFVQTTQSNNAATTWSQPGMQF